MPRDTVTTVEEQAIERLATAAGMRSAIGSNTHTFYRYPARFSDHFAREAVCGFTRPGDTVFDPFVGGGTSVVEALAQGRRAAGCDISELACFVSRVKSTPLSTYAQEAARSAVESIKDSFDLFRRFRQLETSDVFAGIHWQLRRAIIHTRESIAKKSMPKDARAFLGCVLLRTAQWALDNSRQLPDYHSFFEHLEQDCDAMLVASEGQRLTLASHGWSLRDLSRIRLISECAAAEVPQHPSASRMGKIGLILTSPPYLGIHILYNRWQIRGRRETALPFWLINRKNDRSPSHYTFIERRSKKTSRYFDNVARSFVAVASMVQPNTPLIQLVSFSKPDIHLKEYLDAVSIAGFAPCEAYARSFGSLYWRSVPSRRWYNYLASNEDSAREVMLVHRRTG